MRTRTDTMPRRIQRPGMFAGGDGSTLSLDFTTGVLDSRFTFTRSSTATFINSSGFVRYADHNLFLNTVWTSTSTPTGWGGPLISGTVTWNGNGTVTMAASSQRPCIYASPSITIVQGLTYAISFRIESIAVGTPTIQEVISSNSATDTFYKNGVSVSGSTTVSAGDTIGITFVAAGSTINPRLGPGVSSAMTCTMTISQPQFNAGNVFQSYLANSSTSASAQNARFDYDPTTLEPRGLMIEGAATNLIYWSETFDTSGASINWNWSSLNVTRGTATTTPPTGSSATVIKIQETTATGVHAPLIVYSTLTSSAYTVSLFAKAVERQYLQLFDNGGSSANAMFNLSGSGTVVSESTTGIATITPYPNGWYRITMRTPTLTNMNIQFRLSTDGTTTSYAGTLNSGCYIWGAQLETGTAASSYIPTGSSTVQRTADTCIASSTGFSSWFTGGTAGTFYADWYGGVRGITSTVRSVLSTSDVTASHLHLQQTAAAGNLKVADFNANNTVTTSNSITSGARTKGAFSFSGGTVNLTLNGGTVATSSSLVFSTAPTWLVLGGTSTNGSTVTDATVLLNGSIRAIKYWPSVIANPTLQSLTA